MHPEDATAAEMTTILQIQTVSLFQNLRTIVKTLL
jgi:hypothetical protein